ncbi:nicotinamide-nucleotide amidohydrolase family protein [Apilactobacillus quenuiae]|uniref:nicotinamide-nucleotide amidohydrolase family protein n=1 Tax=Apilactobacillus quenuiae TaxID=2008377 RepID=UPI000D020851|nr:nicotinamide-nucleotide amidohydrolase family protein [Apilactobacillus quenuiae]
MNIDASIIKNFINDDISITAAESLTAGLFQSTLGNISGVSAIFPGGFVTYSNSAKELLLDIPENIISDNGVVSEQTAILMAKQAKKKMITNVGVSFTGVAGPDSLENNPAGTVFIGMDYLNRLPYSKEFHFNGNRNDVRAKSVIAALKMLADEYNK